jgi:hypothetical protein
VIFTKQDRQDLQNIPAVLSALRMQIAKRHERDVELSVRYEQEDRQRTELNDRRWKLLNERLDCQLLLNDFLLGKLREDTGMQNAFATLENRLIEHHNAYAALLKDAIAPPIRADVLPPNGWVGPKAGRVKRKKGKRAR